MMATLVGFGPSGSKTHSSFLVRLLSFFVFMTILPPVGPERVGQALELQGGEHVRECLP